MMGFGSSFGLMSVPLPEADAGGIEADDRAQMLGLYGGNALGGAPAPAALKGALALVGVGR